MRAARLAGDAVMLRRPGPVLALLGALLATLVGLAGLDRALARGAEEERRASLRVERLLSPEQFEGRVFAVLRLEEVGSGRVFLYGRHDGVWHCLSHHGAVADGAAVEGVMAALLEAEGVVHSEAPDRASVYGLDRPGMLRLSIHGPAAFTAPDADLLLAFDLGDAVPHTGGTHLRAVGSDRVWAVDVPLRERLAPPGDAVPPLLDPHLIPAIWPGLRRGVVALEVTPPGAPAYRLERRLDERSRGAEDPPPGAPPWVWVVRRGQREEPAHPFQSAMYLGFLARAPYAAILPPERAAELGLGRPTARVRLESAAGEALELVLGEASPQGWPEGVAVASSFSRNLFGVTYEVADLLAPAPERLLDPAHGNPWEAFWPDVRR